MWKQTWLALLALGTCAIAGSSCLVGSYSEVEHLPGASGGKGATGSGATGGAKGGGGGGTGGAAGAGGTGGGSTCSGCTPVAGTEDCCFAHPSQDSVCGHLVASYGVGCLPADNPGVDDAGCPLESTFGLPGCCMPDGLCGFRDDTHGLGCIPAEALGGQAKACSTDSKPCGEFCLNRCKPLNETNPVFACAERCLNWGCTDQAIALLSSPCTPSTGCTTSDEKYYQGCLSTNYQYAVCQSDPDCGRYCNMVQEACTGASLQYPDEPTCDKVCKLLPPGTFPGTDDSIACRMQRAVTGQCDAAGPATTPSICGGTCDAYCTLFNALCPNEFGGDFVDQQTCTQWCASKTTVVAPFAWGANDSHPINCRIQKLVEYAGGTPITCSEFGKTDLGFCK